jgi:hypothetical protein
MTLENILADFQLLDDWEDRYRYVIELGRALPPLPEAARTEANRVSGCASQVSLASEVKGATGCRAVPHLQGRQRRPYRAGSHRHPLCDLAGARMKSFGPMRRGCSGVSGWPSLDGCRWHGIIAH